MIRRTIRVGGRPPSTRALGLRVQTADAEMLDDGRAAADRGVVMRVIDQQHSGGAQVPLEPGVLRPAGDEDLHVQISVLQTPKVRLDAMTLSAHRFRAAPGVEGFRAAVVVAWVRRGRILGTSAETVLEVLPGEALLWDTRCPLQTCIEDDLRLVRVVVDLAEMPDAPAGAAPRPAAVLSGSPMVRSALAFVGTLLQESRRAEPVPEPDDDDEVVAQALIALVRGLVAELEHQRGRTVPRDHPDRRTAIEAHIDSRLRDPALGPVSIGRDFGISVRSVHAAFIGSGTTVAAEIRTRRVAAVQATLRGRVVMPRMAELAVQHGFRDTSQLSRTFRDLSGMPVRTWYALQLG